MEFLEKFKNVFEKKPKTTEEKINNKEQENSNEAKNDFLTKIEKNFGQVKNTNKKDYKKFDSNYKEKGVDQLKKIIESLDELRAELLFFIVKNNKSTESNAKIKEKIDFEKIEKEIKNLTELLSTKINPTGDTKSNTEIKEKIYLSKINIELQDMLSRIEKIYLLNDDFRLDEETKIYLKTRINDLLIDIFNTSHQTNTKKREKQVFKTNKEHTKKLEKEIKTTKDKLTFEQEKERIKNTSGYKELKRIFNYKKTKNSEELIENFVNESLYLPEKTDETKKIIRDSYFLTLREEKDARRNNELEKLPEIDEFRNFLAEINARIIHTNKQNENEENEKSYDELFSMLASDTGNTKEEIAKKIFGKENSANILKNLIDELTDPDSLKGADLILQEFYQENIVVA